MEETGGCGGGGGGPGGGGAGLVGVAVMRATFWKIILFTVTEVVESMQLDWFHSKSSFIIM